LTPPHPADLGRLATADGCELTKIRPGGSVGADTAASALLERRMVVPLTSGPDRTRSRGGMTSLAALPGRIN
jgi:hypothetical protein